MRNPPGRSPTSPVSSPLGEAAPLGAGFDFSDPHSPLARLYIGRAGVCAAVIISAVFLITSLLPLWHSDVWAHVKYGQWIAENGGLPAGEVFSDYSASEYGSAAAYWVTQLALFGTYHLGDRLAGGDDLNRIAGGAQALATLNSLLLTAKLLLLFLAFRRLSRSGWLAGAGLLFVIGFQLGQFTVFRPQLVGEVFFAALLFVLAKGALRPRDVVLIPAMVAFWANCHGSYLTGLILLGAVTAGRGIEVQLASRGLGLLQALGDRPFRRLAAALALSFVAVSLLNPKAPLTVWHTLQMAWHPNVGTMDEWQSIDLTAFNAVTVKFAVTIGVVLLVPVFTRSKYSATQLIVFIGFAAMAVVHLRGMIWWAVLVPWLALPLVAKWAARPTRAEEHADPGSVPCLRKTVVAALLVFICVSLSGPVSWFRDGKPVPLDKAVTSATPWELSAQLKGQALPKDAAIPGLDEALRLHYPDGQFEGRIFASETVSDYLLWTLPGRMPVLIYSHVHLFPKEHWDACRVVKEGAVGWDTVLDREGVNLVVVESESHKTLRGRLYDSDRWQVILDEAGDQTVAHERDRLLIALRLPTE